MKTSTIRIESYKDTGLGEVAFDLGLNENDLFEYGEYLNAEFEVDENLNIVRGKIFPFKSPIRKHKEETEY